MKDKYQVSPKLKYAPLILVSKASTHLFCTMKILRYLVFLGTISQLACDSGTGPVDGREFSIYRLKDGALTASQVWDLPLENLTLADTPFLTMDDLTTYRWQTHEFSVTAVVDSQLAQLKRPGPVGGIPFVVVAGGERIYLGAFWYSYSSLIAQVPYIDIVFDPHHICKSQSVLVQMDQRNDDRIRRALQRRGILIE